MSDTPKAGEVWVGDLTDIEYRLIVDAPDTKGRYVWKRLNGEDVGQYLLNTGIGLVRKPAGPPSDVDCWWNLSPTNGPMGFSCAEKADYYANESRTWRFDAYGNWVPCQGKTVIGPAVKGRP